jgi:hypothetical protein
MKRPVTHSRSPERITVNRWFQKTYGNTYFSAYVEFDDGSSECLIKFEYGYGDHGLYQALKALDKQGYITLPNRHSNGMESYNATIYLREVMKCEYTINDVQRKKDM